MNKNNERINFMRKKICKIKGFIIFMCLIFGIMVWDDQVYAEYDFATMSKTKLEELQNEIEENIKIYHETDGKTESKVKKLTSEAVEIFLEESENTADVSWPWFDYKYTNDWGYYTLTTSVEYKNDEKEKVQLDVYAEAYPCDEKIEFSYSYTDVENFYAIYYLKVGDEIVKDQREELPKELLLLLKSDDGDTLEVSATSTPTPEPTATSTPTPAPTATNTPAPEQVSKSLEKGAKGDEVKEIQERLIELGYLSGNADGIFGNQTEEAIKAFQERNNFKVTGIATSAVINTILSGSAIRAERTEQKTNTEVNTQENNAVTETMVWLSATGSKYHSKNNCGRMNPSTARQVSKSSALAMGYDACSKCW